MTSLDYVFICSHAFYSKDTVFPKKFNSIIELAHNILFEVLAMLDSTSNKCCLFSPLSLCEQRVMVPVDREQWAAA